METYSDQSLEKMKHISHFAEDIGGNGIHPQFKPGRIDISKAVGTALQKALEDVGKSRKRHVKLSKDSEIRSMEAW